MNDPKRWRETEGEEVGMLVSELSKVEPSAELREQVWAKIAPTLPPAPGGGGGGGGGAGAKLGIKLMVSLSAAAAVVGLAIWSLSTPPRPADPKSLAADPAPLASTIAAPLPSVASAEVPPSAPMPVVAPPEPPPRGESPPPRPVERPHASVRPSASAVPAASAAADRLREEAEGVRRVRQLLREKNATAALAELDRLAKRMPNGPLEEEREVLTIEALAASGSSEAARRRAERFLFERPQSVHAARVRALSGN
jgi:hypothetical protein